MISLDQKIIDPASRAAKRMIAYGNAEPLTIVIPMSEQTTVRLSPSVVVHGSGGGNRLAQYIGAYRLAKQAVKSGAYHLVTTQDPFFTGVLGVVLKNTLRVQLEVQCHGDFFSSLYYRSGSGMNRLRYVLGRYYVIPRADRIRVVGERVKQSVLALGIADEKIIVRPVAVDAEAIRAHAPLANLHERYPQYKKIFLALGRLDTVKNLAWLIDIFAEAQRREPGALLLIVGCGGERERLGALVKRLHFDYNVKFEDWTADPISYIQTADALLFPSLSEGYGLVVMEAVAASTPVIMTDVGVANYEVKAGEKVKIVKVGDRQGFIKALLDVKN